MGGRRRRLQQQLEEESIKAANLAYKVGFIFPHPSTSSSKVEQMDNKLSQREEQIVNLGKELEKQRELRLSQVQNQLSQPLRMTSFSMKLFYGLGETSPPPPFSITYAIFFCSIFLWIC